MRKSKRKFLTAMILFVTFVLCFASTMTIFAFADTLDEGNTDIKFLSDTNTYKCEKYVYTTADAKGTENEVLYNMNEKRTDVEVMDKPQITVLTHGLGADAATWSNGFSDENPVVNFGYDESSIIERIKNEAGDAFVYWAKISGEKSFVLLDITNNTSDDYLSSNPTDI